MWVKHILSDPRAGALEPAPAASEGMVLCSFSWDTTSQGAQGLFFGTRLVSVRPQSVTSKPRLLERHLRGV